MAELPCRDELKQAFAAQAKASPQGETERPLLRSPTTPSGVVFASRRLLYARPVCSGNQSVRLGMQHSRESVILHVEC